MLCDGGEVYGVGTIQKLYAQALSDLHIVCMREGALTKWLRERRRPFDLVPGLAQFSAGSSARTLARLPGVALAARRDAARLDRLLRPRGVRIIHTHWLPQQIIAGFMRRRGYRSVWQINNLTTRSRLFGLGLRLNHQLARWGADLILPCSDFIAVNWRGSGVPVQTIRNAAVPLLLNPSAMPPMPLRAVVAGRLEWSKGQHLAVDAVIRAREQGLDVTLDCYGGPLDGNEYADELRARVAEAGTEQAVRFLGFRSDLRKRHAEYHLGLQCRIDPEPCSLWVCETLVDGLPLIASATGGTPELVEDQVTGLLFQSNDASDLGDKLAILARDPARLASMRGAAFERGQRHFRLDRFIGETRRAWTSIQRI
jgi:glycosyltransferase involved in cell wall biosynthesis